MKNTSIKIILVIVTLVIAVSLLTNTVKATGNPLNIQLPGANQGSSGTVNVTQNQSTQQPTNTAPVNTQGSTYQNSNLPQTGDASDYVIFLFIAVCAVVAVFAYRKYRNYNI